MNNPLHEETNARAGRGNRFTGTFCRCSSKVVCFLTMLLVGTIGLILGAVFFAPLLASLPTVIIGAVILAVLIAVTLIYRSCIGCGCNDRFDE